ncbi:MAG: aspartate aminotransferase [Alphaproteobacteria bacterium]|jgi:aspartate aminotransferase
MVNLTSLKKIEKSQTLLINEQSRFLEKGGVDVIKFGFGQSPFLPPETVINQLKESAHLKEYSPVQGIEELREQVALFHNKIDDLNITKKDVFIAPGSKSLIYSVLASFDKADVLIPAPSWVSYVPQSYLAGHHIITVETDYDNRWRITPQMLEDAISSKHNINAPTLLILNYPGNPDGLTYSEAELKSFSQICRKHNILVISDEIYALLNHTGSHHSLAKYYPEGTIITSGLSKWCGAGGWRLGTALLPSNIQQDFKETLLGIASETYSCAPTPVQKAAIEAYRYDNTIQDYVVNQRKILNILGNYAANTLSAADIKTYSPQGAFYLLPDFELHREKLARNHIHTSIDLCSRILKDTAVALLPGTAFGMQPHYLTARLAYVDFNGNDALSEINSLSNSADILNHSGAKVKLGIERIINWVKQLQ